jgi:acyl-CoA synthetase (AMP-forming)/AMP-acid ligase II
VRPAGPLLIANDCSEPFARLLERSAALADRLEREVGLGPGDRLVAALENGREHVELVAAAWRLGLQLIAVAPTASGLSFAGILETASPHAVAVDAGNPRLSQVVRGWASATRPLSEDAADRAIVLGHGRAEPRDRPRRPDRLAGDWQAWLAHLPPAVFYTSGSTSTAKGVPLLWPRILEKAKAVLGFYGVAAGERVMPILPLSHVYGLYWLMGAAALGADCVLYRESASPAALAAGLAGHAATVVACPPIVGVFLFGRRGCEPAVRDRLRLLAMGGAATSREQASRILANLPRTRVFLSYGLAETYSTVCCNEASAAGADPASVGALRFGAFGEVRDPASGRALAPGGVGELCIGGTIMSGYVGAHADAFTPDGLFRTGDLARIGADGAVTITGRLKEMINAGGLSIFPGEIEDVIRQHPAVADCGVFGEQVGDLEVVCAAVAPRQPLPDAAARERMVDELLEHCRAHLAAKMMPRRIAIVAAVPRGALGKIARADLRAQCAQADATPWLSTAS